jgi:hypothetical protein
MKKLGLLLLLALPFCLNVGMQATINPIVEYTSTQTLTDNRPFTLGYSFTTTVPYTINALGVWYDGAGYSHAVGLWSISGGSPLVSTTVLSTDPVVGHFQYDPVSYTLAPGTYVIGAQSYENGNTYLFPYNASGILSLPGYTWGTDCQVYGTGLNFPTVCGVGYGTNGIFYADMSVNSTPEPGTLIMFGSGILGLAGVLRRKINL